MNRVNKNILITGGAGYIGSHFVKYLSDLSDCKYKIFVVDNLENGHIKNIPKTISFINSDIRDYEPLLQILLEIRPKCIIHFSGYAYVGESSQDPLKYFENNISAGINLLKSIGVIKNCNIVFSSSCSVYGAHKIDSITEELVPAPENPYAETKLVFEKLLHWMDRAGLLRYISLRYFNAAGAIFPLKEEHNPETHLIPNAIKAALDPKIILDVYGNDYATPDGTCIRDFIHVADLAKAHVLAMQYLEEGGASDIFNLGTGVGTSVKEVIGLIEKELSSLIKVRYMPRRVGDVPCLVADSGKAARILGWKSENAIHNIIKDAIKSMET